MFTRIDPRTIIEAVRKQNGVGARLAVPRQLSLFTSPEENPPLREAIEFYKHKHNWNNRFIVARSHFLLRPEATKELRLKLQITGG